MDALGHTVLYIGGFVIGWNIYQNNFGGIAIGAVMCVVGYVIFGAI